MNVLSLLFLVLSAVASPPKPTGAADCTPAIETNIRGEYTGWDDEVIYKMDDGSIWEQANYHYHYHYAYHPSIIIYPTRSGTCHIKVEDDNDEGVDVVRIK